MTGTKGNMTSLIFEELTLGKEVTEHLPALLERLEENRAQREQSLRPEANPDIDPESKTTADTAADGQSNGPPFSTSPSAQTAQTGLARTGSTSLEDCDDGSNEQPKADLAEVSVVPKEPPPPPPRIVFDVYTDSEYSKTNPSLPDFRVVVLPGGSRGVLKLRDLVRLSVEAQDTTLIVAHTVDGRVRTRQVMPFSIPRYN